MREKATFYHAGCPVCAEAEHTILAALEPTRFQVEVVHLGQSKDRIAEAERLGVKSVPALVLQDTVFHINYGAGIADLK